MVSSTAIPILIAAIVIVIKSSGIPANPIIPSTATAEITLGIIAIRAIFIERNNKVNITTNASTTNPMVNI